MRCSEAQARLAARRRPRARAAGARARPGPRSGAGRRHPEQACRTRRTRSDGARRSARSFRAPRGHLGRLDRGGEPSDQIELASAGNLDDTREVDLAQLDRRAGERAHHGGGVLGVEQQPHPGEDVAHLRAGEGPTAPSPRGRGRPAALARSVREPRPKRIRAQRPQRWPGGRPSHRRASRAARRSGLRSLCGRHRLERSPANRRADSRLAALRRCHAPTRCSRSPTTSPRRVSEYSGLALPAELPVLEAVDRAGWIDANLRSMRPLLGLLTDRLGEGTGPLAGPLRSASGLLLGAQVGALTGVLSQRVLGQYDLALLDASVPPRLLLLAPNLAQAARNLRVDRDELVAVGDDPRDHPCGPVRRGALAARPSRRHGPGTDRGPRPGQG